MTDDATERVPFKLPNGATMYVEVARTAGYSKVAAAGSLPSFEPVAESIESLGAILSETMRKLRPKKGTLEFGVEIHVESGKLTALICKGSAAANLRISLEWAE